MKTIITCILLFYCLICFSQEKKSVSSGYITFNSGSILNFKNLVIEGENIKYYNDVAKMDMSFSIGAVKKIVDNTGATIYDAENIEGKIHNNISDVNNQVDIQSQKKDDEKLVYRSSARITLNQQKLNNKQIEDLLSPSGIYSYYKEGKTDAVIGKILLGGGIGLFLGGGIRNLQLANDNRTGGGPEVLIAGIVSTVIGIPIRLSGTKKMKQALRSYNNMPPDKVVAQNKPDLKVVAGPSGLGLQLKF